MPIDSATFLKDLKAVSGSLTAVKNQMTFMQNNFEPPPDPDKPGLLEQINTIATLLGQITAINTNLKNLVNGM